MLVLTRRPNEQIEIGENHIRVTVLEVRGGRVRLGIEAPSSVGIRRREVIIPVELGSGGALSRV
jgi:carbon storage regulator